MEHLGLHIIKRFFGLVWLICLGWLTSINTLAGANYVPNEVVVRLSNPTHVRLIAKTYNLSPQPLDQFGKRPIYRMQILDGTDPQQKADQLSGDPLRRVVYAEPNFIATAPEASGVPWSIGGTSDEYRNQWFRNLIGLPQAHIITRGAGVTIAVLDTGIDPNHPIFAGRLRAGFDFVDFDNDPSEVGSRPQNPGYGHGTHVAGLVALVAPESQIIPLRVLTPDGEGNIWVLAEALDYAADPDGNPNTADGANVINMSLATIRDTNLLEDIIRELTCDDDDFVDNNCLVQGGIVVIAGAGNNSSDIPMYPAAEGVNGLLAIAATTPQDTLAAFSNFGSWVHVAAPGQSILSSVPGGQYGTWSGTSMSTPLVAGQAALVRAAFPLLTAEQVTQRVITTSVPIPGPVPRRINVAASVQ